MRLVQGLRTLPRPLPGDLPLREGQLLPQGPRDYLVVQAVPNDEARSCGNDVGSTLG